RMLAEPRLGHSQTGGAPMLPAAFFGFLLVCFWLGAASSAFMTEWAERTGRRSKYILPMAVEAWLLSLFSLGVHYRIRLGPGPTLGMFTMTGLSALAMGLQNATITKISGAVIRTTHLTGVLTDLGLESVQYFLWF